MGGRSGSKAILACLLIVLGGCAGPAQEVKTSSEVVNPKAVEPQNTATESGTPTPTTTAVTATTSTPTETPSNSTSLDDNQSGYNIENLSAEEARVINQTLRSFYTQLPENRTQRLEVSASIASEVCKDGVRISPTAFTTASDTRRQTYRLKHAAETINNNFNQNIKPGKFKRVIDGAGKLDQYTPIVGSYNRFYQASCQFDKDDPQSVEKFYVATASFGVEVLLVQYGATYKVASKATRMASHTRTFSMVQARFGDDALRILMSETHWAVRGSLGGVNDYVAMKYDEMSLNQTKSQMNISKLEQGAESFSNISEDVSVTAGNVTNSTLSNTTLGEDVGNTSDEVLSNTTLDNQAKNTTEDLLSNESLNRTGDRISNTTSETEENLRGLLNESSTTEKMSCVTSTLSDGNLFGSVTGAASNITSDGEVSTDEIMELSKEDRTEIANCLEEKS